MALGDIPCRTRTWTKWSLWVPFNTGYSIVLYNHTFKLRRVSKTTERSILDTIHSVHTGEEVVVPCGCSRHVYGQDPKWMARESKANDAVLSVVFYCGNALSWKILKLEITWTSVFIHQRTTKKWPKYLEVWNLTGSLSLLIRVTKTGMWYVCPVMNKERSNPKIHNLSGLCFH